jgi:hypothetical protein
MHANFFFFPLMDRRTLYEDHLRRLGNRRTVLMGSLRRFALKSSHLVQISPATTSLCVQCVSCDDVALCTMYNPRRFQLFENFVSLCAIVALSHRDDPRRCNKTHPRLSTSTSLGSGSALRSNDQILFSFALCSFNSKL